MDHANALSSSVAARRPAAEPAVQRAAAASRIDLRRTPILQRASDPASVVAQREAAPEEELQMKRDPSVAQRAAPEEEQLQMKAAAGPAGGEPAANVNATGLPDGLKAGVETLSGMSLDAVRVHYNSSQPAQLNALAYAQGSDIHLAPGQERHLPHEAWHVVQQAEGRVQPTLQTKDGVSINDNAGLEHEADTMGDKALGLGA